MNAVTLIGRLGGDPVLRNTSAGTAVASFSVACDESYTDKAGKRVSKVEWVNVVTWGRSAENAAKYLGKGRLVSVAGKLTTSEYTKTIGTESVRMFSTKVTAARIEYLDSKPKTEAATELTVDDAAEAAALFG